VSASYVAEAVQAIRAGADFVRASRVVFFDILTGRATGGRMARMGAGRVLSASRLQILGWQPWPSGLSRRLDGGMDQRLGRVLDVTLWDAPPLVDVKSEVNLWSYDYMKHHAKQAVTPAALRTLFQAHYPEAIPLLDMATKKTTAKKATEKDAPAKLSAPVDKTPRNIRSGTLKATEEKNAAEAAAQEEDAKKTGVVKLKALQNLDMEWTGLDRRVFRGSEFMAPAAKVRFLVSGKLAEEV
jgi:hypothetical protein